MPKVFECPICNHIGLYDEYWDGGRHSNTCPGYTVFIGWLCKDKSHLENKKRIRESNDTKDM